MPDLEVTAQFQQQDVVLLYDSTHVCDYAACNRGAVDITITGCGTRRTVVERR